MVHNKKNGLESILERIEKKGVLPLLNEVMSFSWCEIDDTAWC